MINTVIDISHWQKILDRKKMKQAGISGIIHKATQGMGNTDNKFLQRKPDIIDAGFLFGSYHFLGSNGKKEAERYIDLVEPKENELIMLDTEAQNLTTRQNIIESEAFVTRVFELTGRYPVWYIGNFLLEQYDSFASYEGMALLN